MKFGISKEEGVGSGEQVTYIMSRVIFHCTRTKKVRCWCFSFWPFNKTNRQTSFGLNLFLPKLGDLSFLTSPQKLSLRFFSFPTKPTLNCHKNVVWRCAKKTKEPEQHISLCNGSKIIECLNFKHSIILNKPKRYLEYMWLSFTG